MKNSASQYILRFDDICPTMNWQVWSEVDRILSERNIKPIMAVVPDNRDPKLVVNQPASDFWEKVRIWQSLGWSIGIHGYQHVYMNKKGGILVHPNRRSEFAGLSYQKQKEKLCSGIEIFQREGINVDCWVAPAHTFDWITVDLLNHFGVKIISDGYWPWPHTDNKGITWVPLQLSFLKHKYSGIWGVAYHINSWDHVQLNHFQKTVDFYLDSITSMQAVVSTYSGRRLSFGDSLSSAFYWVWDCWTAPVLQHLLHAIGLSLHAKHKTAR